MTVFNKWSKTFAKRPHRRLVTPPGCEWIRPIVTSIYTWFLGPTKVIPKRHLDRFRSIGPWTPNAF